MKKKNIAFGVIVVLLLIVLVVDVVKTEKIRATMGPGANVAAVCATGRTVHINVTKEQSGTMRFRANCSWFGPNPTGKGLLTESEMREEFRKVMETNSVDPDIWQCGWQAFVDGGMVSCFPPSE